MEWFIYLLFGHLFGDYLLQNNWMALNKKHNFKACIAHCTIYTLAVTAFLVAGGINCTFQLFSLIFLSHIILDGTTLVDKWMKFYNVRSWNTQLPPMLDQNMTAEQVVKTVFGAIIYVVMDNTLHLFMMFVIIKNLI